MLIEETDRGSRALDQLKAMKVKVAIDDFGTGYSSLSYLRRFPVDTIKIDKSFVAEMATSSTSAALVKAVVDLANSLGVATVAEGIENPDQKARLNQTRLHVRAGLPLLATAVGQQDRGEARTSRPAGQEPDRTRRSTSTSSRASTG